MRMQSSNGEPLKRLRIGVSVGDVVVQGDDLLGDGVNTAARLQSAAEPGGLAMSGEAMAQIRGKIDIELEDCGFQKLKDTDAPVRVYKTGSKKSGAPGLFDFDEDNDSASNDPRRLSLRCCSLRDKSTAHQHRVLPLSDLPEVYWISDERLDGISSVSSSIHV
jgi:hypothetical protein